MRGKKVLGMVLVMAMVMTAIPLLSGNVKAMSKNSNNIPNYLVVVRKYYGSSINGYEINKTSGSKYHNGSKP